MFQFQILRNIVTRRDLLRGGWVQVEDVLSTLQLQLVFVVTRVDGFHGLLSRFTVEAEIMRGEERRETVEDAQSLLVHREVELRVLQHWKLR